ncbi:hypothetical protein [Demequina sp. NBRC 110053]|uniref:hypothetical protein n=1 Tax=Demequina sp. NBRC 110053 TaxID=1570342 RepID=UPI0013566D40|nr:hypothetical protein [Demequina sp. NBRC 110053]
MSASPTPSTHRAWSLLATLAFAGAFVGAYWWFVRTEAGQEFDHSSLAVGIDLRETIGQDQLSAAARLGPWIAVVPASALILATLLRRRWRRAMWAAGLPVATYLLATALHDVILSRPYLGEYGYGINTVPSEHLAVAIASLAVIWSLLPQGVWRGVLLPFMVAYAGLLAALEVTSFAALFADVLCAVLLAGALAASWSLEPRPLGRTAAWVHGVLGVASGAVGAWLLLGWAGSAYESEQQAMACLGLGLTVASGTTAVLLTLPRRRAG